MLDHNTTSSLNKALVELNDFPVVNDVNDFALYFLQQNTQHWTGVERPKDYDGGTEQQKVNYSNYNARLLEPEEVARITGADKATTFGESGWGLKSSSFYFGSLSTTEYSSQTDKEKERQQELGWLFDRISSGCKSYGCANNAVENIDNRTVGYWLSSPGLINNVWVVSYSGGLLDSILFAPDDVGVRPVITVSKSKLIQQQ